MSTEPESPAPPRRGADAVDTLGRLPAVLHDYEIVRKVGEGAMGRVYEARSRDGARRFALKTVLGVDPQQIARFKGEFRRFADLSHPNLARLERFVQEDDGGCWFTMEFVEGVSFDRWVLDDEGRCDVPRLRDALRGLVRGIRAIHDAGLLHRDLKPSNVLVEADGRVVVVDFGLAVPTRSTDDETEAGLRDLRQSSIAGTRRYMSPEQGLGGAPSPPADWYALGVMLYELLAGRPPYRSDNPLALLKLKLGGKAPPPGSEPDVPEDLSALCMSLLAARAQARPTADAIARAVGLEAHDPWARRPHRVPGGGEAFEGREAELFELHDAFRKAGRGLATLRCVAGTSGVGKTALVQRFLAEVRARDRALVLSARCRERESVPYKAFDAVIDALAGWLATLPDETVEALLPHRVAEPAFVFPVLKTVRAFAHFAADAALPPDPAEVRRRAFAGLRELLARIAEQRPTVLCIDDLHWGDRDSALLLLELLAPPSPPPMLILGTWRAEEAEGSPMIEELARSWRERGLPPPVLELGPLPTEAAARLARTLLDGEDGADRIAAESGGSPFLIEQLVEDALLGEREPDREGPRLQRLVRARTAELPAEDRALLRVIAAAGRPLSRSVARRAAGLVEDGAAVSRLRALRLIRTRGPQDSDPVECYHDRLRAALVEGLSPARTADAHRAVAAAMEADRSDDWDALADHHAGSGDLRRGVEYAVRAARAAAELLAFDRAASGFERARRWGTFLPPDRAAGLAREHADALVLAGRCAEAAPLYLEAADDLPAQAAVDARRRAAEAFLVSGRVDRGTTLLKALLTDAGLPFPATPGRAVAAMFGRLLLLRLRGLQFVERDEGDLAPARLGVVDLCDAAAKGLVAVDNVRGAYFSVRALGLALQAGEPSRVGRGLATVGAAVLAPAGGLLGRWGRSLAAAAERIAARRDDPLLRGAVAVAAGQIHVLAGEWRQALALSDSGVATLADHGRGGAWERSIGRMGAIRALEELGRPAAASARALEERRRADALGDRYAAVTASLYAASGSLAADDPAGARRHAEDALRLWGRSEFDIQQLYALRVLVRADLYEGRPQAAWERVAAQWPALRRSMLLRVPIVRIDALVVRAAAATASAATLAPRDARRRRAIARAAARTLAREGRRDTAGHAAVIEAGLRVAEGRPEDAAASLRRAETAFVRADMATRVGAVRFALAHLLPASAARGLRAEAASELAERGIVAPARWAAVEVPGVRGGRGSGKVRECPP